MPDVGIVTFSTSLNLDVPDIMIGSPPAVGSAVVCAGNGYDGTPSTPEDQYSPPGPMEQWNTIINAQVPGNVSPTYFYATGFGPGSGAMNGKPLVGDSGGPTFAAEYSYNTNGVIVATNYMLIGLHSTQTGNGGEIGEGVDVMLSASDTLNFITNNSFAPQTLAIQAQGTNAIVTWVGSGILQSAANLSGSFADVTNAASPYTNSIANSTQQFFRLRPN